MFYLWLYGNRHVVHDYLDNEKKLGATRKEGNVLFNIEHILFTLIWHQTYGKGPLR